MIMQCSIWYRFPQQGDITLSVMFVAPDEESDDDNNDYEDEYGFRSVRWMLTTCFLICWCPKIIATLLLLIAREHVCVSWFFSWTAPWWWAEVRNSESPERAASVFAFLSVYLCVCLLPTCRPQFLTHQPNFLKICSLGVWEKSFFSVSRNFDFWPFEGPFSAIFEYFLLYPL